MDKQDVTYAQLHDSLQVPNIGIGNIGNALSLTAQSHFSKLTFDPTINVLLATTKGDVKTKPITLVIPLASVKVMVFNEKNSKG